MRKSKSDVLYYSLILPFDTLGADKYAPGDFLFPMRL